MLNNSTQLMKSLKNQKIALIKGLRPKGKRSSEEGLSLLECLVAIVVVAAVISAITPPIFLSVATRVQNRRADQAKQLAQAGVDRVRRLVERGNYSEEELKRLVPEVVDDDIYNATVSKKDEQLVDIDGDDKKDFRVQVFRTNGVADVKGKAVAFKLGVRVYVYFPNTDPELEKKPAPLKMTTALGSQRNRPLAVMYNSVAVGDSQDSLSNYCKFIDSGASCP